MNDRNELETLVEQRLEEIKPAPPRDPHKAARGRALFLSEAVSASALPRQKGWTSIFKKERYAMNAILSILVAVGLLFGGGTAVSAAQDDLPNEPLYAVKIWTEDLSLQFQDAPEEKVDRLMDLTQTRIQEMIRLSEEGEPIPDQVTLRLEQHIQQALQLCANMDDPTLERALLQIRDQLQQQDRDMERLQLQTRDQLLTRTRRMIQERLRLVEDGLLDPEMFREQARNGFRFGQDDEPTPPAQDGNGQQHQNGQPTEAPAGPNTDPSGPNTDPGGPNTDPGGPNTDPAGPNADPGGPNADPNSNTNDSDNGANGNGLGGDNANNNGSGGSGRP